MSLGVIKVLLNSLVPPRCLKCSQIVEKQGALCSQCWLSLTFIEDPFCFICGVPFEHTIEKEMMCGSCMQKNPPYKQARALMVYDAHSKPLILNLKHADGVHMAPYFSQWIKRILPSSMHFIVPIPLHWTRLFRRGYNQSALLTNVLAKATNLDATPDLLIRKRRTRSQGGLRRQKRIENVSGAFKINKKYHETIKKKHILVVDDVFTTGATLLECTKMLKKGGAKEVSIVTLARSLPFSVK